MTGIWLVAFILQWLLLGLLTVLFAGILRYLSAFQERMQAVAPVTTVFELGQRIFEFELPDVSGAFVQSKEVLSNGKKNIVVLGTSTCPACRSFLSKLNELMTREEGNAIRTARCIFVVAGGTAAAVGELLTEYPGLRRKEVALLIDTEEKIATRFGVTSVPTGVAVDQEGHVLDQSKNPHAGWIYKVLGVLPPIEPLNVGGPDVLLTPSTTLVN
jgi:thiol-disulfide isomerase/thioredoxin